MKERTYIEVDLQKLRHNVLSIKNKISDNTKIICVIKANAYGHGSIKCAHVLEGLSCVEGFAVAVAQEAIELRRSGITKRIMLLGPTYIGEYEELILNDIDLCVFSERNASEIAKRAISLNKTCNLHIKIDIGMNRIGLQCDEDGYNQIKTISKLDGLNIVGIFSHFSNADESNLAITELQLKKFMDFVDNIKVKLGLSSIISHVANSAASLRSIGSDLEWVRAGIIIYGISPSRDCSVTKDIQPIMSLKSHVIHIKTVPKGAKISYGGTCEVKADTKIATVAIGYGDGYPRDLSSKGWVLINGQRASILGRICMDQMMVDITMIDDVDIGDIVTLIGEDGDECITFDMLAEISSHFQYEIPCCLTNRVEKYYIE